MFAVLYVADGEQFRTVGVLPVPARLNPVTEEVALWVFGQHDVDLVEVWDGAERLSAWSAEEPEALPAVPA